MERSDETLALADAELETVSGGLALLIDPRTLLSARLSEIFKNNNPPKLGPQYLLDR